MSQTPHEGHGSNAYPPGEGSQPTPGYDTPTSRQDSPPQSTGSASRPDVWAQSQQPPADAWGVQHPGGQYGYDQQGYDRQGYDRQGYDPAQGQAPQRQWGGAQDPQQGWQVQPAGGAPYGGAGGFPGDAGDDPTRPSFYQPNLPPPVPGAQPVSPGDEKLWATLSHVGMIVTGVVGPLIIWLVYKDRSRWLKLHAGEALNFSILATAVYFVSAILTFVVIGTVTWAAMGIVALIFGIMAAMAANRGEYKPYPFTVRIFK